MLVHRLFIAFGLVLLTALAVGPAAPARAQGQSTETPSPAVIAAAQVPVEALNEGLRTLLRTAATTGRDDRRDALRPVVRGAFHVEETLRLVAGSPYASASPAEQDRLEAAFVDYSVARFVNRFKNDTGQGFEITGTRPARRGLIVDTRLVRPSRDPVQLSYVVQEIDGRWGIVDVYLDGRVSQLAVQRSEFAASLRQGGVARLTADLNALAERLIGS